MLTLTESSKCRVSSWNKISRVPDQNGVSQACRDTPFWSETLEIDSEKERTTHIRSAYPIAPACPYHPVWQCRQSEWRRVPHTDDRPIGQHSGTLGQCHSAAVFAARCWSAHCSTAFQCSGLAGCLTVVRRSPARKTGDHYCIATPIHSATHVSLLTIATVLPHPYILQHTSPCLSSLLYCHTYTFCNARLLVYHHYCILQRTSPCLPSLLYSATHVSLFIITTVLPHPSILQHTSPCLSSLLYCHTHTFCNTRLLVYHHYCILQHTSPCLSSLLYSATHVSLFIITVVFCNTHLLVCHHYCILQHTSPCLQSLLYCHTHTFCNTRLLVYNHYCIATPIHSATHVSLFVITTVLPHPYILLHTSPCLSSLLYSATHVSLFTVTTVLPNPHILQRTSLCWWSLLYCHTHTFCNARLFVYDHYCTAIPIHSARHVSLFIITTVLPYPYILQRTSLCLSSLLYCHTHTFCNARLFVYDHYCTAIPIHSATRVSLLIITTVLPQPYILQRTSPCLGSLLYCHTHTFCNTRLLV